MQLQLDLQAHLDRVCGGQSRNPVAVRVAALAAVALE